MDGPAGAYGGGKAGGSFDPITFVQRPQIILRALSWLFSIIVFGCISSQGWLVDEKTGKDVCLYNGDASACHYGVGLGVIGFLASMCFIVGEYLFEQMSSVRTRKQFVLIDLAFSAGWALLYFIGFCYLANQWGKADDPPMGYGVNNVQAAIVFSFFSIGTWGGCAYFAFQRFRLGVDAAFALPQEPEGFNNGYSSYPLGGGGGGMGGGGGGGGIGDNDQYNEPPFNGQSEQRGPNDYQAPTY